MFPGGPVSACCGHYARRLDAMRTIVADDLNGKYVLSFTRLKNIRRNK